MKQKTLCVIIFVFFCFFLPSIALSSQMIFQEDFESGWGDYWGADNGLWEIGTPSAGPAGAYSGEKCAGTVLDGNYGEYTDSRLITPTLQLPNIGPAEEIHFRFMNWFSFSSYDAGYVQISIFNENTEVWSDWENLISDIKNTSPSWSMMDVDLTAYACKRVKIAFYHTADRDRYNHSESTGWYIDDIMVFYGGAQCNVTEDFESGWSDCWGADNGLWEIGTPTAGPDSTYAGEQCVGTVLDGNYGEYTDSRLITPALLLPALESGEEIHFRFMNWFSFSSYDAGYVQVSVFNEDTEVWSDWENLISDITNTSPSWSMMDVDLTTYACKRVKIAFYHTADRDRYNHSESTGWYIDDVRFVLPERFRETASQTGQPDIYEPDDTREQASIADLNEDTVQLRSFHKAGDRDWIKLYGNISQVYSFNITGTGFRTNMVLDIYDGTTDYLLKRFYVQSGCEKSISWTCPADGLYYIATAQMNPDIYGDETQYSLEIYPSFTVDPVTLELNEGTSDTITIRGGNGPYSVVSSDKSIVSAQLFTQSGTFVKVEGLSAGTAAISISDSSQDADVRQVMVTITEAPQDSVPEPFSKAIIVAGGGPYPGNALWDTTRALAKYVYIALLYQGFTRDTIQYLSSDMNVDIDGNGLYDEVDALATNENLQEAISKWAIDADELVVFITDHGGKGSFQINETELLQANDLDLWLDELQQVIPGKVTVVYDACRSGSFLPILTPPPGKDRIAISSTKSGQEAYFTSFGDLSFSSFFWQHIINGMNVYDAFLTAKNSIEFTYARQMPQLDDNATGMGNEDGDGEIARSAFIGKGLISGGGIPIIDGVSPKQILEGETSAVLYAENVFDSDGIQRVWAVITPPDYDPGSPDEPVLNMPVVEMKHVGDNRYQGLYNEFTTPGTYNVALYAKDVLGSIAVPAQTSVVKLSGDESIATFDQVAGLLSIPCLDLGGTAYSLNLFLADLEPVTLQLMPDIVPVDNCSPCASFDLQTNVLHVNNIDLGVSYWVDLQFSGSNPMIFSLIGLGKNEL